ncbi:uncharacterized protein [Rutidosis leptorrhynchoides]|uniref:uncharacterized protein n=1 Tax=Rutidosis leptorrhynchoides TaxID=125765 RepID=UPI003A992EE6
MSKLDRFFISPNLLNVVDDFKGTVLARGYSDHAPIFLFQDKVDFGPTYFKIFDSWFARDDFDATVRNAWDTVKSNQNLDIIAKFRLLKSHLKGWIHSSRSVEACRLQQISQQINDIDVLIDAGSANPEQIDLRNKLFNENEELSKFEYCDLLQKSRVRWDVEGDENSKFFHCSLKHKRSVQQIQGLMVDGVWEVDPCTIKNKFFEFYRRKFDVHNSGATFGSTDPNYKLTVDEANLLEADIDDTEIKRAVWDCGSSKAPGPDGITFRFIKHF